MNYYGLEQVQCILGLAQPFCDYRLRVHPCFPAGTEPALIIGLWLEECQHLQYLPFELG